jgi:hypothetical protein
MFAKPSSLARGQAVAWLAVTALALAGLALPAPLARANPIDLELKQLGPMILEYCQAKGWKNVGVLKFRVQMGKGAAGWNAGQLNSIMALRLENVLILANDADHPIGITRNASAVAMQQSPKVDYLTAAGRQQLLQGTYPLAWGKQRVKVDAFLTGLVTISPDYKKTTVQIEVFDHKDPVLRPLALGKGEMAGFTVGTDRTTVADLSRTFYLSSRPVEVEDKAGEEEMLAQLQKEKEVAKPKDDRLPFDELLQFKVFYDDKEVKAVRVGDTFRIPSPKKGQKVYFTLTSRAGADEQLGVVLLVNGINTFRKETLKPPGQYSKWVLAKPGMTYYVRGFYPTLAKAEPFEILPEEESANYPLADSTRRGQIELHLFRQAVKTGETQPDLEPSLRSDAAVAGTLEEAKQKIISSTPAVKQGLILPGAQAGKANIRLVPFNNNVYVGHVTITYFQPGSKE